tara:strand:- start:1491 stop:1724 length:234 start_codon:yes stop_codon:yes gene_type:complete
MLKELDLSAKISMDCKFILNSFFLENRKRQNPKKEEKTNSRRENKTPIKPIKEKKVIISIMGNNIIKNINKAINLIS